MREFRIRITLNIISFSPFFILLCLLCICNKMNFTYIFLFSITIINFTNAVKVSIYYEALCPDSVSFITRQLAPTYSKLKDHIKLDFVPYGKAIHNYEDDRWVFDCQHGPAECRANKYQSCALAQKSGQDNDLAFISCVMKGRNPGDGNNMQKCAEKHHINWNAMSTCARSAEGDQLLAANGDKTNNLEINISFVPTIILNDVYDDNLQSASLTDFLAVVCSKIVENRPSVCNNKPLPRRNYFY